VDTRRLTAGRGFPSPQVHGGLSQRPFCGVVTDVGTTSRGLWPVLKRDRGP
jgi:hypothetical protein